MKPIISLLLGFVLLAISHLIAWAGLATPQGFQLGNAVVVPPLPTTTSITQYGITWTFANPVGYGQFVNGDYWVVDSGAGVKVINITPGDSIRAGSTQHMNGSMVNPQTQLQGYDGYRDYDATKNVGIGISETTPLLLTGNVSLVSTISNLTVPTSNYSYVKTAAVLTCLNFVPPVGSFRPGISTTNKTLHNKNSINYSLLKGLTYPSTKPDIAAYTGYFQMVWLTHNGSWTVRNLHPSDTGLDNYYYPVKFAEAALMLHLDYTNEEKYPLLINYIQLGIDTYSYIESGATGWPPNGGHSYGKKWPILFAGLMLDYTPMKNIGQKSGDYLYSSGYGPGNPPPDYIHFAEDGQTFYVTQFDVDKTSKSSWISDQNRVSGRYLSFDIDSNAFTIATPPQGTTIGPWNPDTRNEDANGNVRCRPYSQKLLGMPEWGIRHSTEPQTSDATWSANYRTIGSGPSAWAGTSLAARFMGATTLWNNNAHFDYIDRYMAITNGKPDPFGYAVELEKVGGSPTGLIKNMWDLYRPLY
jgi:hypothetical protein